MGVLLLAGGQPAGPGLPVSVSPPGAHHRVGTPILLLIMVPNPAWMGGSCCLPLAFSLFGEWYQLLFAPSGHLCRVLCRHGVVPAPKC